DDPRVPILKGIFRRSWVRHNLLVGRTQAIADALQANGRDALFLEGPILAARYYPDPPLRPTSSIHVLVPPDAAADSAGTLEENGWRPRAGSGAYPGGRFLFDESGNTAVLRS